MSRTNLRSAGHITGLVATVLSLALAFVLFLNRQYIADQITVWQYQPASEIISFADRSGMNDGGKFAFYASQPSLESAQSFNDKCDRKEESTAILGCYNGHTIYIYDVTNQQLDGIREVTAAHEMLHAAYDRMSDSERQRINTLIEAEYEKLKNQSDFSERMAFYDRTEPGERDNELHSIIGTEVRDINVDLEAHYKKYFSDRSKVVALHSQYATVFSNLQSRADELSNQLTSLGEIIKSKTQTYNAQVSSLNASVQSFNARANKGDFASQSEFNAERSTLQSRADELDAMRTQINNDIDSYNQIRSELITIASQSEALNQSIDSTLAPAPSV